MIRSIVNKKLIFYVFLVVSIFAAAGLILISALEARLLPNAKASCGKYLAKNKSLAMERHLVILKENRAICLFEKSELLFAHNVSLGKNDGAKRFEGDKKTPEGVYYVTPARASNKFIHFMEVSYPNERDAENAKKCGQKPGGAIGIHGAHPANVYLGKWQAAWNHSDGCIVMDRPAMKTLSAMITTKTKVKIVPLEL